MKALLLFVLCFIATLNAGAKSTASTVDKSTATSTQTNNTSGTDKATTDESASRSSAPANNPPATTSTPYTAPAWLWIILLLVALGQIGVMAAYFGLRGRQDAIKAEIPAAVRQALEPLNTNLVGLGDRINNLRQDIVQIRQSQEPILALAVNRLASANQFPFGPQLGDVNPNQGAATGGTRVAITGRNFSQDAQVWFGGASAQVVNSTAERLNVIAPPGSVGDVDVFVVNSNGMMTQQRSVRYGYIDFHVEDIPNQPQDGGLLTLRGAGYTNQTTVLLDGNTPPNIAFVNDRTLTFNLPNAPAANTSRVLVVTNPNGDRVQKQFTQG